MLCHFMYTFFSCQTKSMITRLNKKNFVCSYKDISAILEYMWRAESKTGVGFVELALVSEIIAIHLLTNYGY